MKRSLFLFLLMPGLMAFAQKKTVPAESLAGEWRWVGRDVPELILVLGTDEKGALQVEHLYTYRWEEYNDPEMRFDGKQLTIRKEVDENAYIELYLTPEGEDLTGRCLMTGLLKEEFDGTITLRRDYFEYAPGREDYRFFGWPGEADADGNVRTVNVIGSAGNDTQPAFERQFELVWPVPEEEAMESDWVNDRQDINFDGIPDLQVFLGYSEDDSPYDYWAAYVWDTKPQGHFVAVDGYSEIDSPLVDPATQTISSTVFSGPFELTVRTYAWEGGQLVLTKEETVDYSTNE